MITAKFYCKPDRGTIHMEIRGHSGSAPKGEDLICSAAKYTDERDFSYGQYIADRDYAFQQQQAEEAKRQWEAEFEEAKRQYDQNYALSASRSSRSSGGGYSSSGSSSGSSSWGSGISTDNGGKSSGGVTGSAWALTKNNLRQNLASGNYERAEQYLNQIIDQVNESQYKEIVDLFDKYGR